jgi:hypothetical protein
MEYSKPTPSPFWFEFKLATTCTIPKFNATLYCQLVGGPFVFESYLYLYFALFPGICKHPIKAIGKKKKDTLVCLGYSSVWDTLHFKGDSFVGWFHCFRLGR